jgi:uncharacterized protein DUF6489
MQIKIEIDVKPEELRRFLGLPDVAGLQEDIVHYLREKVEAASENFDPATFVKENLQTLRNSGPWKKILSAAKVGVRIAEEEAAVSPAPRKARPRRKKPAAS